MQMLFGAAGLCGLLIWSWPHLTTIWMRTPPPISLAVLPFRSLDSASQREIEDIRIGVPYEIRTDLVNIGIKLSGFEDILAYEKRGLNDEQLGRQLQADYVLTGTIHGVSETFGLHAELMRIKDGVSIWANPYDDIHLSKPELLSVERDIAKQVASALGKPMNAVEQVQRNRDHTQVGAAYELYLDGRTLLLRHTDESIRKAAEAFNAALRLDPNYALAYAGLAMASAEMPSRFAGPRELHRWAEQAKDAAKRALELNNNLPEAHQALAAVYRRSDYNWEGTLTESRAALKLNASLDQPHYYLASAFYHLGLLDKVQEEVRAALEVNREDRVEAQRNRGVAALLSGHYADAVALLEEVQRLSAKPQSDLWLARAYYYLGKSEPAKKMLEELSHSSSVSTAARSKATLAGFLARSEPARAEAILREVNPAGCEHPSEPSYMDHHVAHSLGSAYAQLGKPKEAVCWLRRAAYTGFPCYPWYVTDPLLEPLRADPNFLAFLADQRKNWELAKARY